MALALCLVPSVGHADELPPVRFIVPVHVRGLFYRPASDTQLFGENLNFKNVFQPETRLMPRLDVGLGAELPIGALSINVGVGYWCASGKVHDLAASEDAALSDVSLRMIPLSTHVQWAATVLHSVLSSPLVPFAEVGYAIVPWKFSRDATPQVLNQGLARGWELNLGVQLILDDFDPRLSGEAQREFHIHSSAIACDYDQMFWREAKVLDFSGGVFACGVSVTF